MSKPIVVFDAYGTLFDVNAAARAAAADGDFPALAQTWPKLAADWREKQLQYTWLRAISGLHTDFWQVTQDGLDWAMDAQGLDDPTLRARLLDLYKELSAYPEVPAMLKALKAAGHPTAILSNGSPQMLSDAVTAAGLDPLLDEVLSVEEVGIFKPADAVYDLVHAKFGPPRGEVLFVSSNNWDASCAASYGFRTLWVNRADQPLDRLPGKPDFIKPDLSQVPSIAANLLNDRHGSGAVIGETKYFTNPDGLRLAYRVDGDSGPPLLCLCGLTRNMADFDFVARDFQDRAQVIRLDTRGRGQSDWDPNYLNYTLKNESRDALALLDHLGIEKTAILGTSRGGLIALVLGLEAKDRLTGVCFNDIGPEIMMEGLGFIATYLGVRPTAQTYEEAAEGFAKNYAAKFPGLPKDMWETHARRIYREGSEGLDLRYDALLRRAIFEQAATDDYKDLWALFDTLNGLPLALIRGANSDLLSSETAAEMGRRRPDMIYREVPDRGHVPFLDEPSAKSAIAQFLEQLP